MLAVWEVRGAEAGRSVGAIRAYGQSHILPRARWALDVAAGQMSLIKCPKCPPELATWCIDKPDERWCGKCSRVIPARVVAQC